MTKTRLESTFNQVTQDWPVVRYMAANQLSKTDWRRLWMTLYEAHDLHRSQFGLEGEVILGQVIRDYLEPIRVKYPS